MVKDDYSRLEFRAFEMEATIASLEEELAVAHKETDEVMQKCESLASELTGHSDKISILNLELTTLHEEVADLVRFITFNASHRAVLLFYILFWCLSWLSDFWSPCHYIGVYSLQTVQLDESKTKQEKLEASLGQQITENEELANVCFSCLQIEFFLLILLLFLCIFAATCEFATGNGGGKSSMVN